MSATFDNSKLGTVVPDYRAVIPFEHGAREIVAWHTRIRPGSGWTPNSTRSWIG